MRESLDSTDISLPIPVTVVTALIQLRDAEFTAGWSHDKSLKLERAASVGHKTLWKQQKHLESADSGQVLLRAKAC